MKIKYFLFMFLIALFSLSLGITVVSLSESPVTPATAQETTIFERNRTAFETGRAAAIETPGDSSKCSAIDGQGSLFCLEFFFYEDAKQKFTKEKDPLQAGYRSRANIKNLPTQKYPLWAYGFGFAVSDLEISPNQFKEIFFDQTVWHYFIDGWALKNVERHGGESALTICEKELSNSFDQGACAWGVGRGIFFFEREKLEAMQKPSQTSRGFEFATDFSQDSSLSSAEIAQLPESGKKAAQISKLIVFDSAIDAGLAETATCLRTKHASLCAGD